MSFLCVYAWQNAAPLTHSIVTAAKQVAALYQRNREPVDD